MIKNQWYAVLSSSEVNKNQLVGVRRLGMDLVFYRDNKGEVSCLMDMCSHRGAALSKGKVVNNCNIQCPFHGLEFNGEGECQFIPANGINNQGDLTRYNVSFFKLIERHGIIYIWYGDKDKSSDDIPFHDEIDKSFVFSEFKDHWNTHYSRAIENQLDVVHLPFVHHNTIGAGGKTLINGPKVIVSEDKKTILTSANNEVDEGQAPKKSKDCKIKSTFLKFKFPNVWLNNITDKIKVLIFFAPIDDENTILYLRFYNKITGIKLINRFIGFFGKFANLIIERQDKRVVETQRPKASSLKSNENLIYGDKPIIEYRKLRDSLQHS